MKNKLSIILCISIIATLLIFPAAYATQNIKVLLDDNEIKFDVNPQLIEGRTMVPLRAIFEALGATVKWDDATETVTAYKESCTVKATIGVKEMLINGSKKQLDVAPIVIDDRTLVPARFVAEAFNCEVVWDEDTNTVKISSAPASSDDSENISEPASDANTTPVYAKGMLQSPYLASDGEAIAFQEYNFEPKRIIALTCTNIIRGQEANTLANSENRYNDKPTSAEEWCFLEFNLNYISSEGGANDVLKGSDVIYTDKFYTSTGSSINVKDMATLGTTYRGYGVFDTKFYPGSSGKIVIGLLLDKNIGDILLCVPNKGADTNSWILCNTTGNSSDIKTSYSVSDDNNNQTAYTKQSTYYNEAIVPFSTYDSVTGSKFLRKNKSDGYYTYCYTYTSAETFTNYIAQLVLDGWKIYKRESDKSSFAYTVYMVKSTEMVSVVAELPYNEVWILFEAADSV